MIEPRVYRAAFLPALLCVVVAMFSLENRPAPAPQGLAADVLFEGRVAVQTLRSIERGNPDRRPGSPGNAAVAERVAAELAQRRFGTVVRHRFEAGGKRLVNVVATRPGASRDRIVVLAGRDTAPGRPDATGTAADTAALLELARVLQGRATRRTLVLASVDGNSLGYAGARRFVETAEDRDRIRAVVVLSNLAASTSRGALVIGWSNDASRANIALARTVSSSLRQELGGVPREEGPIGQLARLALPIGIGAQGPLIERGVDAVRISGSGELPPDRTGIDAIDVERFGALGRASLRTLSALDGRGRLEHGPRSYVIATRNVLPGWALALLAGGLILPALVAAVDAFARASRRGEGVGRFWGWMLAAILPFLAGLALAELLVLTGAAPDAPPAPLPPAQEPLDAGGVAVLGAVTAAIGLGWLLLRPLAATLLAGTEPSRRGGGSRRRRLDPSSPGAGAVVALFLAATVALTWVFNPFAALALAPALHLWLLVLLTSVRRELAALLVLAGLALPAVVAVYYLARLSLDPLEGAWYAFLLLTGHHGGIVTALLGCCLLGALGATISVVAARRAADDDGATSRPRVRGPGGYAGPGSLGGTGSALRR